MLLRTTLEHRPFIPGREVPLADEHVLDNGCLPILAYHRVAEDGPASLARYRTSRSSFAAQMRWLRDRGYRAVNSMDLARAARCGHALPARSVMITFDDGYRDVFEAAWPILREHGFTAEVMVVSDLVGTSAIWDVRHGEPAPLMDWSQIRRLCAAGIQFGSHTATHAHLRRMTDQMATVEALRSKARLERELGVPCLSFAAPFGESDARVQRILEASGYFLGLSCDHGVATHRHSLLRLPRLEVRGGWSMNEFAQKFTAAHFPERMSWRSVKSFVSQLHS